MTTRVLIVDDHALLRQGVRQVLELEPDIDVVGEASDGKTALVLESELAPDVIVLDVSMPGMNGVEVARLLKKRRPEVGLVMLTIHSDEAYSLTSLQAGASSYMLKDVHPKHLIRAIREAARGRTYMPPDLHPSAAVQPEEPNVSLNLLTNREREVLLLVARGMTNQQIAASLYISEKTVKNHLSSIFEKLGVSDRTNAALLAIKSGFVASRDHSPRQIGL